MMKTALSLIAIVLMTIIYSCGGESAVEVRSDPVLLAKKHSFPFNTPKEDDVNVIKALRGHARDLLKLRQNNLKSDLFDLTYYYIVPRGFSNENRTIGQKAFVGYWTKFENNFEYNYGIGEEVIGGGSYHYNDADELLLMLDHDSQIEPKLWSLLSNSEFFNFLGHPILVMEEADGKGHILLKNFASEKYIDAPNIIAQSNNGMQIMMTKVEERPQAIGQ